MAGAIAHSIQEQLLHQREINFSALGPSIGFADLFYLATTTLKLHVHILDSCLEPLTHSIYNVFQNLAWEQPYQAAYAHADTRASDYKCQFAHLRTLRLSLNVSTEAVIVPKPAKQFLSLGPHLRNWFICPLQDVDLVAERFCGDDESEWHGPVTQVTGIQTQHPMKEAKNINLVARTPEKSRSLEKQHDQPNTDSSRATVTRAAPDQNLVNSKTRHLEVQESSAPHAVNQRPQVVPELRLSASVGTPHASQLVASVAQQGEDGAETLLDICAPDLPARAAVPRCVGESCYKSCTTAAPCAATSLSSLESNQHHLNPAPQASVTPKSAEDISLLLKGGQQSTPLLNRVSTPGRAVPAAPVDSPSSQHQHAQRQPQALSSAAKSKRYGRHRSSRRPTQADDRTDDDLGGEDPSDEINPDLPAESANPLFRCPAHAAGYNRCGAKCKQWRGATIHVVTRHALVDAKGTPEWQAIKRLSTSHLVAEERWQKYFNIFKGTPDGDQLGQPFELAQESADPMIGLLSIGLARANPRTDAQSWLNDFHRSKALLDSTQRKKRALHLKYNTKRAELDAEEAEEMAVIDAEHERQVRLLLGHHDGVETQQSPLPLTPVIQVPSHIPSSSGDLQGLTLSSPGQPSSFTGSEADDSMVANFETSFGDSMFSANFAPVSNEPFPARMETTSPAVVQTSHQLRQAVNDNMHLHPDSMSRTIRQQPHQHPRHQQHSDGRRRHRLQNRQTSRPQQPKMPSDSGLGESAYTPTTTTSDYLMPAVFGQALAVESFDQGTGMLAQGLGHGPTTFMGLPTYDSPTSSGFHSYDHSMSGQ
jgi:hypothetical protein